PAFSRPGKPVGPPLPPAEAAALAARGVTLGRDGKGEVRRLASSPVPLGVAEGALVRRLGEAGTVVIAAGGGGPPVFGHGTPGWAGAEAGVGEDRTAGRGRRGCPPTGPRAGRAGARWWTRTARRRSWRGSSRPTCSSS